MVVRAYVLLNTIDGRSKHAVQMLRSMDGVVIADWLEGYPEIIVVVEAPNRQRLAESIMPVIGCIDGITEDLHLMVTRENELPPDPSVSMNSECRKRKVRERRPEERRCELG